MEPSDGELVLAAKAGDAQSLAVLLIRHRAAMHAVAAAVMGAGSDVEDVVQDASLVAITDVGMPLSPGLTFVVTLGWKSCSVFGSLARNLSH